MKENTMYYTDPLTREQIEEARMKGAKILKFVGLNRRQEKKAQNPYPNSTKFAYCSLLTIHRRNPMKMHLNGMGR